jgi:hypothetical protein
MLRIDLRENRLLAKAGCVRSHLNDSDLLWLLWVYREDLDVWQNPRTAMTVLSAWK